MNPTYTRAKGVRVNLRNRFSGFENTGYLYNNGLNLSVRSSVLDYILPMKSIDTSDKNNYKYVFGDSKYDNKSLQNICKQQGDPSENPDIRYLPDFKKQMNSYEELRDVLSILRKKVETMMKNIQREKAYILKALNHYQENMYTNPEGVSYSDNYNNPSIVMPVYPLTIPEVESVLAKITSNSPLLQDEKNKLIEICTTYGFLMLKIGKKGLCIDDYLNNAITCFKIMGDHVPEVVNIIAPDFDKYNTYVAKERGERYTALLESPRVLNYKKGAFLALKYGSISINPNTFNLYVYFGIDDPLGIMNLNIANPAQGYNDFTSQYLFIKLKEIVGFSYDNISCLLNVFCHEFGHQIGAGGALFQYYPYGINISPQSSDILAKVLNKTIIVDAFKENNLDRKQGYTEISLNTSVFGEYLADFISLLVLEKYVNTLPDLKSKYEAIISANLWACGSNTMDEKHPPKSMRVNMVFLCKKLHSIYNMYKNKKNYSRLPQLSSTNKNLRTAMSMSIAGGTRRKNRKNRKETNRRRR
jgi:hypothetical protein